MVKVIPMELNMLGIESIKHIARGHKLTSCKRETKMEDQIILVSNTVDKVANLLINLSVFFLCSSYDLYIVIRSRVLLPQSNSLKHISGIRVVVSNDETVASYANDVERERSETSDHLGSKCLVGPDRLGIDTKTCCDSREDVFSEFLADGALAEVNHVLFLSNKHLRSPGPKIQNHIHGLLIRTTLSKIRNSLNLPDHIPQFLDVPVHLINVVDQVSFIGGVSDLPHLVELARSGDMI